MNKKQLLIIILSSISFVFQNCSQENEKGIDCSLIDCFGGDILKIAPISNNSNLIQENSSTPIVVEQNGSSFTDMHIDATNGTLTIFLYSDEALTISIETKEITIYFKTTYIEGECCSGNKIDEIYTQDATLCNDQESCDQTIQLHFD